MRLAEVVESDPEKLGGTPVFKGTRVPIKNFFDYLEGGDGINIFLEEFPTVERAQVLALLDAFKTLISDEIGDVDG